MAEISKKRAVQVCGMRPTVLQGLLFILIKEERDRGDKDWSGLEFKSALHKVATMRSYLIP